MIKAISRFSIRTLMLATLVLAMALSLIVLLWELIPLRAEVQRLRDEFGVLSIEDPTKVHAIKVPTRPGESHEFRVYLPAGRQYALSYRTNGIPDVTVPDKWGQLPLNSGEYFIRLDVEFFKDKTTGKPLNVGVVNVFVIDALSIQPFGSCAIPLSEEKSDWIVSKQTGASNYSWSEVGRTTVSSDIDRVLVLHKTIGGIPGTTTSRSDGFMLWIESEPLATPAGGQPGPGVTP